MLRLVCATCVILAQPAWGQLVAHPADADFAMARDAFAKGDRARLVRAVERLGDHPLAPWGEYFVLTQQIGQRAATDIEAFIVRHEGTYLAEKMRGDWVRALVRRDAWPEALAHFDQMAQPDADLRCIALGARLRMGEPITAAARGLLAGEAVLPESCHAPLARLVAGGELDAEEVWQRLRRQWSLGRLKEARVLAGWLPRDQAPSVQVIEAIIDHPVRHLTRLPERFAESRRERELAMFAVVRMSRADVRSAATRWGDLEARFGAAERAFVRAHLAWRGALGHLPEASAWFDAAAALGANFTADQHAWRVRAALRAEDWPAVARAIDALPADLAERPEWIYWRARAHLAAGMLAPAHESFRRIADRPDFYGILATEALGRRYVVPAATTPPGADELAAAQSRPGLLRGLALIGAGMRIDGVREWNWALRNADDRLLLAAAELAHRHEVIDRAISSADRTRNEHDFARRYPTPFIERVEPHIRAAGLDTAWVYGLMRQESRFIMDARSSAGAQGLMQLMPATARYVAQKIGMRDFRPGQVNDMDTNVVLGTRYLRMVADSLDDHPVLASAAYNAGPGRARKWRAERPIEGALYAETIPFDETRDYVRKVMANAVVYAALKKGGTSPSLTARLGTIRPRAFVDGTAEDLP